MRQARHPKKDVEGALRDAEAGKVKRVQVVFSLDRSLFCHTSIVGAYR
jgi:hypothetical protein